MERVAAQLGNTAAVCRKSYIHPEVIGGFLDGRRPQPAALQGGAATAAGLALLPRR